MPAPALEHAGSATGFHLRVPALPAGRRMVCTAHLSPHRIHPLTHGFARAVFSGRNSRTGHRDMPAGLPHPRPQRWPRMETHPAKRSRNHPLGICLVLLGMGVELFPGVVLCPRRSEAGCIRGSEVPFLPALVHRQPERQLLRRGIHRHAGRAARHPDTTRQCLPDMGWTHRNPITARKTYGSTRFIPVLASWDMPARSLSKCN